MREAHRQTQSKDPVPAGATGADAGNFRIDIRFFGDHEVELPSSSRAAAALESPARKCE
jgi:hypothetical protein